MADPPLKLRAGSLELELSPSIGGAISNFIWAADDRRAPILRQSNSPLEKVIDAAAFPLVPFVNRIRGGCFTFQGRKVRLSPNMADEPCPLHGQGWVNPWRTESASEAEAVLVFAHEPGEWPWDYEARQNFRLVGDTLCLRLTCRNASDEPMPCGLGFHPYFPCGADTVIQTSVQNVWTVDDNVLPVERIPAVDRYDIGDSPACGRALDNGYDGWSGRALLTDPGWPFEIVLSSPQARFFQLYSPKDGGIFVAEPVTHANAALNAPQQDWAPLGIRVLQPDEEMALDVRLEIQPK